jgi:hypothetical protein
MVTEIKTDVLRRIRSPTLDQMRNSRLMRSSGGYAMYSGLPGFEDLRAEATALFQTAKKHEWWEVGTGELKEATIDEDRTISQPRRHVFSTSGGPIQQKLYRDPSLLRFLSAETELALKPKADHGSYSYYVQPGDFIGLHRDAADCDLAVITVLYDTSTHAEQAGGLLIYRDRLDESIYSIRESPSYGAELVKGLPGQTLLLLGGLIPHRLIPVRSGQCRIISALCFRLSANQV